MTVDQLGIEHQTVFGLPPVEFVNLAADLGCGYIAVALSGGPYNPHGYEPYSGFGVPEDSIDRMVPGEGELTLREILAALPPDIVIGLEVPMRSRAEAGEPTHERARRCVRAARDLLAAGGTPAEPASWSAWTVTER